MTNMSKRDLPDQKAGGLGTIVHRLPIWAESGQAFVELAVGLAVLVLLLVGAAEYGRLAYFSIEVTNAARAGVGYGAQSHVTASDSAGMIQAALNDGSNVPGLSATASSFCTCPTGITAVTCNSGSCAGGRFLESVQVNTTATVTPIFSYPGLSKTYTLTGQAVMRVEQ